jgi:tetratricopeptide (TPR) repeat protein
MKNQPGVTFQAMTTVLKAMKLSSSEMPKTSEKLAALVEIKKTEEAVVFQDEIKFLSQIQEQSVHFNQQSATDKQESDTLFKKLNQAQIQSTRSIVREFENPQNDIDSWGDILTQGIITIQENQGSLNQIDLNSEHELFDHLDNLKNRFISIKQILDDIHISTQETNQALASFVDTTAIQKNKREGITIREINRKAIRSYNARQIQKTRSLLEEAVANTPNEPTLRANLALLLLEMGDVDGAENAIHTSEMSTQNPEMVYISSLIEIKRGAYPKAIELLQTCLESITSLADEMVFRLSLAEAWYGDGHPQQALKNWQRVLEIDPAQPTARSWVEAIG